MENADTSREGLPGRIGPYKVLDVLGEGGMGTVYLAEQSEPVRRRVALKVIKLGMDSKRVLARFEAERQALAMMEHDSIARVYDAGATERGQPYVAMELVKGVPITEYCDANKLDLPARIGLFAQVCSAVQHAHHKGVIHRDLTPRNILVTLQDGQPMPKVIDFGLARATGQRLTEKTLFTEAGAILGTPEYMSPEQAGLAGLDVDTRADVYSLGVILYELLVGELPFSSAELRSAGALEVQRVIREVDPPRPSTKLSSLGEEGSGARAQRRATDVASLRRRLKGDLDWIVMRALEKDRTRRYGTPEALADDLQRYVADEPVLARPPSVGYRAAKFVKRYKVRVALGAALVLSLVAGFVTAALLLVEADAQRRIADEHAAAADAQKERAESANDRLAATLTTTRALGLATAAMDEVRSEPTLALLLALEAVAIERIPESISALHRALASCHERRVFDDAAAPVLETAVSPDGAFLLTGGLDGTVRLWDRSQGRVAWLRGLEGGATDTDDDVRFVAFLGRDGDRIVAANLRGDLVLFDRDGTLLDRHAPSPQRLFGTGVVAPDGASFALGYDGLVQVVTLAGVARDHLEVAIDDLATAGQTHALAFSEDGALLAVGEGLNDVYDDNGRGHLWHVGTGIAEDWGDLLAEPRDIRSLDFSADGSVLLVGVHGGRATRVDLDVFPLSRRIITEDGVGHCLAFLRDPSGRRPFLSFDSRNFYLFDDGGRTLGPVALGAGANLDAYALAPDKGRFVVGGFDGRVRVRRASGGALATLAGHRAQIQGVRFLDPGGDRVASWSRDGTVRAWIVDDPELVWRPGAVAVGMVRPLRDGIFLTSGRARFYDRDLEVVREVASGNSPRHAIDLDRGRWVAAWLGLIRVFDFDGEAVWEGRVGDIESYCLLPGTTEILFVNDVTRTYVLDYAREDPTDHVTPGPVFDDGVFELAPSPDGRRVAARKGSQRVVLTEREGGSWSSGKQLDVQFVSALEFSPDGAVLLCGTLHGTIHAYDGRTGEPLGVVFSGHRQTVTALTFRADGALVASASLDGTARLWRPDGTPVAVLEGPPGGVNDCAFTPDGTRVWTAHDDGTVRKWFVDVDELVAAAKARVSRELTHAERVRFARLLELSERTDADVAETDGR